jgi:hypothetical protein
MARVRIPPLRIPPYRVGGDTPIGPVTPPPKNFFQDFQILIWGSQKVLSKVFYLGFSKGFSRHFNEIIKLFFTYEGMDFQIPHLAT